MPSLPPSPPPQLLNFAYRGSGGRGGERRAPSNDLLQEEDVHSTGGREARSWMTAEGKAGL